MAVPLAAADSSCPARGIVSLAAQHIAVHFIAVHFNAIQLCLLLLQRHRSGDCIPQRNADACVTCICHCTGVQVYPVVIILMHWYRQGKLKMPSSLWKRRSSSARPQALQQSSTRPPLQQLTCSRSTLCPALHEPYQKIPLRCVYSSLLQACCTVTKIAALLQIIAPGACTDGMELVLMKLVGDQSMCWSQFRMGLSMLAWPAC